MISFINKINLNLNYKLKLIHYFIKMNSNVLKTTKALSVTDYNASNFEFIESTLPELKNNELLIKVHYVPLIHYDLMTMSGVTGKKLPYTPCVELSGIVEDSKSNKALIGKKISFLSLKEGTLKSRIIVNEKEALILNDKFDLINGCIMSCNPFTALGVVDMAQSLNAKAFAVTCGNSNVGIQINRIAEDKGLKCISIVRSDKRVKEMLSIGQKYVINSSDEKFVENLNELMIKLEASVTFDTLSGNIVGKLMKALPKYGILVNFGTQTHEKMSDIDATDFRWGFKEMKSFLVGPWIDKKIEEGNFDAFKKYINDHMDVFVSESGKVFDVNEFDKAVDYANKSQDAKKVVIDLSKL